MVQEDIDKNTTPCYRAPEQCNLYSKFPINEQVDVWALGCILFSLCYQDFPFEAKLATIRAKYRIPETPKFS